MLDVHKNIRFDEAEKNMIIHPVADGIDLKLVPYDFLKNIKLLSLRPKDLLDIAKLEELRNK